MNIIKHYPKNERVRAELGSVFFHLKNFDLALLHLHRAQKLEAEKVEDGKKPETAIAIEPLALLCRLQVNRGYFQEAVEHCDLMLKIMNKNRSSSRYMLEAERKAKDTLWAGILATKGAAHLGLALKNQDDLAQAEQDKKDARRASNESIQKMKLGRAHTTVALLEMYSGNFKNAQKEIDLAHEARCEMETQGDEIRVVELMLLLREAKDGFIFQFEEIVGQLYCSKWSLEIARRFPRDDMYGRVILARLLILDELYEWAHFEMTEILKLETNQNIQDKFPLLDDLLEGLNDLWKLVPQEIQEKCKFEWSGGGCTSPLTTSMRSYSTCLQNLPRHRTLSFPNTSVKFRSLT
eukprot:TRINITY_DN812_c0_g1_i1.p1 TRINITY_DN812_c0_g1~~TRINITY_DN812_c0_g1_i1.p1  ORF type:complete len:351 (+),score=77.69 TRINITY_DN812_c0_g1_i1:1764-2816(+)